ncbi:MAG: DNA repair protein RecO [Erysipelotrichaceae bacterium]|nr:DNA repair protein RecO [Erysipelotrichaceae bacterium]
MNEQCRGIILKQADFKDNDYLLTILTDHFGMIKMIARGAKKATSKNSYACSALILSDISFDLKGKDTLNTLKSISVVKSYKHLKNDLIKIAIAGLMSDIIIELCRDTNGEEIRLFTYYSKCLEILDNDDNDLLVLNLFLTNSLKVMGIDPQVDSCCVCGSKKIKTISLEHGGFVCGKCVVDYKNYDIDLLKRFRLVNKATIDNYKTLITYGPYEFKITEILYDFLSTYGDINLKSWRFLKELMITT